MRHRLAVLQVDAGAHRQLELHLGRAARRRSGGGHGEDQGGENQAQLHAGLLVPGGFCSAGGGGVAGAGGSPLTSFFGLKDW